MDNQTINLTNTRFVDPETGNTLRFIPKNKQHLALVIDTPGDEGITHIQLPATLLIIQEK